MQLLRTGNPNHKASGPGGGQFTSGGGGSGGATSTHGKHFAKRQRRRQRKLEKLRQKGHARIAELKGKHSKERKALRTKHREKGTSYSDRRSEYQALRTKHKGESRQTVDTIKKEVRESFPKSTGKSSKAKEFRERVEKGTQKLGEIHGKERQATMERHAKERGEQQKTHREERKYTRDVHAEERRDTIEEHQQYHREDAEHIIKRERESQKEDHADQRMQLIADQKQEWKDARKEHRSESRKLERQHKANPTPGHVQRLAEQKARHAKELGDLKQEHKEYRDTMIRDQRGERKGLVGSIKGELDHNRETHSGRLKDALHAMRQDHAEQHAELKEEHGKERQHLAKSHRDTRRWMDKAHKAERREAITRLKQEIQGRSYERGNQFVASSDRMVSDRMEKNSNEFVFRDMRGVRPRFSTSRVHKANSAEAILKHVLRQRGWTAQYDGASLTGKQHLSLLDDVRQYGRMWLRHEAESFFDRYGVEIDERDELGRSFGDLARTEDVSPNVDARGCDTFGLQAEASTVVTRGIASRAAGALGRFFDRAGQFIRELIVAGAMALKGDDHLTNAEIYAVDRLTRKQYEYLDKFRNEVQQNPPKPIADLFSQIIVAGPPPMTEGQFVARLEMYGNAPWEVQNIGREIVKGQHVFQAERRVHKLSFAQHRPCQGGEQGCLEQSQAGWQPIGSLREIGDCFCMTNCDCYFEWQDPAGKIFTSPWGRHNPRGYTGLPGIAFPEDQPAIPALPSGPGPQEKPPRKIKLKPVPKVGEPYPKGGTYPPARPDPTIQQIIDEAGSPHSADYYEEI